MAKTYSAVQHEKIAWRSISKVFCKQDNLSIIMTGSICIMTTNTNTLTAPFCNLWPQEGVACRSWSWYGTKLSFLTFQRNFFSWSALSINVAMVCSFAKQLSSLSVLDWSQQSLVRLISSSCGKSWVWVSFLLLIYDTNQHISIIGRSNSSCHVGLFIYRYYNWTFLTIISPHMSVVVSRVQMFDNQLMTNSF